LGEFPPKQPFYISSADENKSLAIAGIWSSWKDENDREIQSAAIITQEAVGELARIHSRMPVFMPLERWSTWLDPQNRELETLINLMRTLEPAKGLISKAWLEFTVSEKDGKRVVCQEASFSPRGLGGQPYWYFVLPFHVFVFPTMLRNLIRKANRTDYANS